MIWLTCPQCQVKFPVREDEANRPADCPRCGTPAAVPSPVPDSASDVLEVSEVDCVEEVVPSSTPSPPPPAKEPPTPRPPAAPRKPPPPSPKRSQEPAVDAAFPEGVPSKVAALGDLEFAISVESWARPLFFVLGWITMAGGLLLIIPGVVGLIPAVQSVLKEMAALFILGLFPALFLLVIGLVMVLATMSGNDWRALFFEDGFVLVFPKRHQVWRYQDIRGLYTERIDKRTYMYGLEVSRQMISNFTVEHVDGVRFSFRNGCPRNREIGELLTEKTALWQLPLSRKMLERGEEVEFRPFVLSDEGIERGRAFVSWDDIDDVDVQNGMVRVRARGRVMFSVKASQVANVLVFMAVTDDVLEGRLRI